MLFHTPTFLLFFVVLVPVFLAARRSGRAPLVLVVFSQVFYGWWDWRFLILLWATILLDYVLALRIAATASRARKRMYLATSIVASLSLLGFFKYWNFLVGSVANAGLSEADGLRLANVILPVGISFYTFQSMGYVIDIYRNEEVPVRNLLHYASFVCYFPHMVAGPIMRLRRLLPQIIRPEPMTLDRVMSGLILFSYGFLCKAVGDVLASLHDPVFADLAAATPAAVTFAIVSFGLQIYFDFLGYCEMARGVSRILGIELMRNFRAPYTATSFRGFWRRWHISLSEWLRDYLYISLGGNRSGMVLRVRNLMLTMLLGGLWHGAGWNFLIWGGLHGLFLSVNTLYARSIGERLPTKGPLGAARSFLGWAVTLTCVMYAWLYFRIPTFPDAMTANQQLLSWLRAPDLPDVRWGLVVGVAALLAIDVLRRNAADVFPLVLPSARRAIAFGALGGSFATLALVLVAGAPTQQFIYFQF
jgi:alginate O-acetyltransferase complex protein AlgI